MSKIFSRSMSESKLITFRSTNICLEHETNDFTRKLERERRVSNLLNKDLEELVEELGIKNKKLHRKIDDQRNRKGKQKIGILEENLDRSLKQLSEIKVLNLALKNKICAFRKEKNLYKTRNEGLKHNIEEVKSFSSKLRSESIDSLKVYDYMKEKIDGAEKSKEALRNSIHDKIGTLASQILSEAHDGNRYLHGISVKLADPIANASEVFQIIKNQANLWKQNCIKKRSSINEYSDFIKILNDGMEKMRRSSKKALLNENVNAFLNYFEESNKLSEYLDKLRDDLSRNEDELSSTRHQINLFRSCKEVDKNDRNSKLKQIDNEIDKTIQLSQDLTQSSEDMTEKVKNLNGPLTSISRNLKTLGLIEGFEYGLDSSKNAIELLQKLEKGIDLIIFSSQNLSRNDDIILPPIQKLKPSDVDIEAFIDPEEVSYPFTVQDLRQKATKSLQFFKESHK
ncbi:unnamed protein product [Blepharisma stoltei]|uniref:Uncharacterized protein n=1 Tax=Blepharisma stoltei TaxID=1481888 RepID=A0AAU9IYJ0_9CILI|nr:unnamed protein product [Blepharisma stoltei]